MKKFAIIVAAVVTIAAVPVLADDGYTSPMVVPGAAFHTDGQDPDGLIFNVNGYIRGDGSAVTAYAPVYLPDGATITSMTVYAVDGSDACTGQESVGVYLNRTSITDDLVYQLASATTTGVSSTMQTPTDGSISPPLINNLQYRYYLRAMLCSSTHNLYAVALEYTE